MFSKLRWMTIVVLAVLLSAGPVAALDGADRAEAPHALKRLERLELLWSQVVDFMITLLPSSTSSEEASAPPPLEEGDYHIEPNG